MIISLSGYAGSGKDTAAKILQRQLPGHWEIKKFADALRQVASILTGLPVDYLYTEAFKTSDMDTMWDYVAPLVEYDEQGHDSYELRHMTGRQFLQWLGTDAIRKGLHEDTWKNALLSHYKPVFGKEPDWLVTDTRFPNELQGVRGYNAYTIWMHRYPKWFREEYSALSYLLPDQLKTADNEAWTKWYGWRCSLHESETAIDGEKFDAVVNNNYDIEELTSKLLTVTYKIQHHGKAKIYPAQAARS